jgi:large subunit ribosomal protein L19
MNTDLLTKVEQNFVRRVPEISVGDQVEVHTLVREKNRQRIQVFKGLIIAIKGSGLRKMFTVRKISSGIGVEKIWPLHSPNIKKIVITKKGNTKRSKLYYLRDRIGKKALKVRTSEGLQLEDFYAVTEEENTPEEIVEDEIVKEEVVSEKVATKAVSEEKPEESKDEEPADKDSK